jgi:hypothetical protein
MALQTSAGPILTNPSIGAACRPIVLVARACSGRFRFFGIANVLQDNCQKTLDMAQGDVLILAKCFFATSG